MRQIGSLPSEPLAHQFADFLVTCSIEAHAELEGEQWAIWVRDEDHVAQAAEKFREFQQDPNAEQFRGVSEAAEAMRMEEFRRREQARSNVVDMRTKWRGTAGAVSGPKPLTITLIVISVIVFFVGGGMDVSRGVSVTYQQLNSIEVDVRGIPIKGGPLASIQKGEIWRLITPIFMHFGATHIIFNCLATWTFARQVETTWSTVRLGVLVIGIALIAHQCQILFTPNLGGHIGLGGGLSGVVFGLFGYLWMKSRYDRRSAVYMSDMTVVMMIGFLFLCMTPLMSFMNVANVAHVTGLLAGMAFAFVPTKT